MVPSRVLLMRVLYGLVSYVHDVYNGIYTAYTREQKQRLAKNRRAVSEKKNTRTHARTHTQNTQKTIKKKQNSRRHRTALATSHLGPAQHGHGLFPTCSASSFLRILYSHFFQSGCRCRHREGRESLSAGRETPKRTVSHPGL